MASRVTFGDQLVFLCVDASENSQRAFEWFHRNYHREEHTLGIVHIYSMPVSQHNNKMADVDEDYGARVDDVKGESSTVVQKYLNYCAANDIKSKVFLQAKTDSVGRTICDLVKEHRPLSIVMGQRGLGAVKRALYGSVSEHLLHHARIPLLVVPPVKE